MNLGYNQLPAQETRMDLQSWNNKFMSLVVVIKINISMIYMLLIISQMDGG